MKLIDAINKALEINSRWLIDKNGERVSLDSGILNVAGNLDESGWSVVEPPPPKRGTKIVKVTCKRVDELGEETYYFNYAGALLTLCAVLRFPKWTGRVEVTFADGKKSLVYINTANAIGSVDGHNHEIFCGQPDFIPAVISGVEFWSE